MNPPLNSIGEAEGTSLKEKVEINAGLLAPSPHIELNHKLKSA